MKKVFVLFFFILFANLSAESCFPAGIVYGPKAAFKIDAPDGWILDNESGKNQGLPCVLYPNGYTWKNAPVVMYAKIGSTDFESKDKFIKYSISELKKRNSTLKYKLLKEGKIDNKYSYTIYEYWNHYGQTVEQTVYIQLPKAVAFIVFNSPNREQYNKSSAKLKETLESFMYIEMRYETKEQ